MNRFPNMVKLTDDLSAYDRVFFFLEYALEAGRCVMDTQCRDIENIQSNRQCVNWRCVCKEGFILINHTCHEGK